MNKKYIWAIIIGLSFLGCGGGSSSQNSETIEPTRPSNITISGTVVDGEIEGAEVFLDLNRNDTLDSGEPVVQTNSQGEFNLTITPQQQKELSFKNLTAPLVAFGGKDIRTNEPFEDYLMGLREENKSLVNITPFTTLIAQELFSNLDSNTTNKFQKATLEEIQLKIAEIKGQVSELFGIETTLIDSNPIELAKLGDNSLLSKSLQLHKSAKAMKKAMQRDVKKLRKSILRNYKVLAKALKKLKKDAIKEGDSPLVSALDEAMKDETLFEQNLVANVKKETKLVIKEIQTFWEGQEGTLEDNDLSEAIRSNEDSIKELDNSENQNNETSQNSEHNVTNQNQNNETFQNNENNVTNQNQNNETSQNNENNVTNQNQNNETSQNSENNITNKMIFFSPNATYGTKKKHPKGTFDDPMLNTRWLCQDKPTLEGYTFYFRGGVYHNPDFNTTESSTTPDIYCSGTKKYPIVIKPWKDEHVKIKFDSAIGIKLSGDYLELEGFEIEGMAQEISYEDAINHWWKSTRYYNGGGVLLNGVGLRVRDNIIHDTSGAGIGVRSGGTIDDLIIENNVIFNASWWNVAGTTAIGLVNFDKPKGVKKDNKAHIVVKDNLVFASESRIFSRVYSKGFSHLSLDEGSSMLIKNDNGSSYDLGFLIENNFFLYNGKGVSIRWDDTIFRHNTFYNNGTTIEGKGAGFRSNGGKGIVLRENAAATKLKVMEKEDVMNVIDFSKTAEVISCSDNLFEGGMSLLESQKCLSNNTITTNIFNNPSQLDFTTSIGAGASQSTFERLKKRVEFLGYHVAPTNYTLNIDGEETVVKSKKYYEYQQARIKALVQEVEGFESISELGTFKTPKGKEIYGYEIIFSDKKNITGNKKFYLEVSK